LNGLPYEAVDHDLRTGEQRAPAYLAVNPQGYVPALELEDGTVLTQSPAILEWLEETHPHAAAAAVLRHCCEPKCGAVAAVIACDTHPCRIWSVLQRVAGLRRARMPGRAT
jgi:maleylpyruvate isomerase